MDFSPHLLILFCVYKVSGLFSRNLPYYCSLYSKIAFLKCHEQPQSLDVYTDLRSLMIPPNDCSLLNYSICFYFNFCQIHGAAQALLMHHSKIFDREHRKTEETKKWLILGFFWNRISKFGGYKGCKEPLYLHVTSELGGYKISDMD